MTASSTTKAAAPSIRFRWVPERGGDTAAIDDDDESSCRFSSSNISPLAVSYRFSGSFCRQRPMIRPSCVGNSGLSSCIGRGSSRRMLVIVEIGVSPTKGFSPVAIW